MKAIVIIQELWKSEHYSVDVVAHDISAVLTPTLRDFNFRWAKPLSTFAQWKQPAEC